MPPMWECNSICEIRPSQFCHKVLRAANSSSKLLWKQGAGAKGRWKSPECRTWSLAAPDAAAPVDAQFPLGSRRGRRRAVRLPPLSSCETVNDEGSPRACSLWSPPPLDTPTVMDELFCKWSWRGFQFCSRCWTSGCRTTGENFIYQKQSVGGRTPVVGGDGNTY